MSSRCPRCVDTLFRLPIRDYGKYEGSNRCPRCLDTFNFKIFPLGRWKIKVYRSVEFQISSSSPIFFFSCFFFLLFFLVPGSENETFFGVFFCFEFWPKKFFLQLPFVYEHLVFLKGFLGIELFTEETDISIFFLLCVTYINSDRSEFI